MGWETDVRQSEIAALFTLAAWLGGTEEWARGSTSRMLKRLGVRLGASVAPGALENGFKTTPTTMVKVWFALTGGRPAWENAHARGRIEPDPTRTHHLCSCVPPSPPVAFKFRLGPAPPPP